MKLALLLVAIFAIIALTQARLNFNKDLSHSEKLRQLQDYIQALEEESDQQQGSSCASHAISRAQSHKGDAYVFGATGPKQWDCSSFVQMAFSGCYSLPRTSGDICSKGSAVSLSNVEAGDVICYPGHVALAISNSRIIHAANSNRGVVEDPIYDKGSITTIRRF